MFCKTCRYNLRGLLTHCCPECGRPFNPADPDTFSRSGARFEWLRALTHGWSLRPAPDIRPRATIAILALFTWSVTALADPVSMPSMISGPFMIVHVRGLWPWNAWTAAAGVCILALLLLWIITDRKRFAGLAIVAGVVSVVLSRWLVLHLMMTAD